MRVRRQRLQQPFHRRCLHCGHWFVVDPRVRNRQRYCSSPACVKASRAAAQRRWLSKPENRDHFRGKAHVFRVQQWRKGNAVHGQRQIQLGRYVLRGKLAGVVRELALQDLMDTHFSLLIGLVSHLTDTVLQDEMAREIRRLILLGHGILEPSVPVPVHVRKRLCRP